MMLIMHKIKTKPLKLQIEAFTLLESLLVLALTSFLILLFSMNLTKVVHITRGELFVLQFENLYKDTQSDAILLGKSEVLSGKTGCLFYENKILTVPTEVEVKDFSIVFDEKGGNSSLQKLCIFLPYEKKTITYQLEIGSGKFKKTIS